MQSPISSPNPSSGYHPTLSQLPKSQVFSGLITIGPIPKQSELIKLTNYRDEFYHNHILVKPDKIRKFVLDCTAKAVKPEDARAIGCALLTIRDSNFLPQFFDFVFLQQKSHGFDTVVDHIWPVINDSVRKSFPYLSSNACNNTLRILTLLYEKNISSRINDLSNFLVSSIDSGCITQLNLILIEYFIHNTQKFQNAWVKLEHVTVNLLIKFLRFYQDIYSITVEATERPNLSAQNPVPPVRSISASTSSIPILNDSSFKANMALCQKALSLGSSYENFLPTFFNIGITTNTIARCGFKEIVRILYDPRTFQKMSNKFPIIYKQLSSIPENFISCFTICFTTQVMLQYQHLKEMLSYVNNFTQKSELDFPSFLKRNSKLIDIDFILSDAIRTYLQSVDYERNSSDLRFNIVTTLLHKGIEKGAKLNSSLHSLICDFFFIPGDLNDNPESQKKTLLLVLPAIKMIEDPKLEKLSSTLIEMMLVRLKQHDFTSTKINSVRSILRFLNDKRGINVIERVNSLKYLNDKHKEEFRNMFAKHDNNDIPSQILDFSKKNLPLDSQEGINAIIAANEKFRSLYAQNGNNWVPAIPSIKKIFDTLASSSRKGVETILDMVDVHATTPCMSFNFHDAQVLLKFVNDHNLFQEFDEALQYTDQKFYCDALVKEISTNSPPSRYRQFLTVCKSFRRNVEVLKNICDFCPTNLVMELADLPYLDVGPEAQVNFLSRILSICSLWSNDSQTRLTTLLSGIIITPSDIMSISDVIIKNFEQLPSVILLFFQNMMIVRVDPQYAQIMQKIKKINSDKAQEFCCLVLGKWASRKNMNQPISRTSLVPDVML